VLYGTGALLVAELVLVVYCVLNIITTPEPQVRNLPKVLWLVLVLVFPLVGGIAWLVAGRPQGPAPSVPYKGNRAVPAEYDRPGRATAAAPDDDEAFLRRLRERAEEQRRKAEQERRARENEG
jgi:2-polyprenyl-6-methoxyphenol hydroxylase-like FAD-dependent oxidoreductase